MDTELAPQPPQQLPHPLVAEAGRVGKIEEKKGQGSARTATEAVSLGSDGEDSIIKLVLPSHVTLLHPPDLALPNLVHHLVALNRSPRRSEPPRVLLGTDLFLDGAVVLLPKPVQILNWPMIATRS
jgi:hypothetical protein